MSTENTRELLYEGSVKRVWKAAPGRLWFEFTDDYSVFDWGKMPDTIANKGRALTVIGAYLFRVFKEPQIWKKLPLSPHLSKFDRDWLHMRFQHKVFADLKENGLRDHYKGLKTPSGGVSLVQAGSTEEPVFMEVRAADVARPTLHRILHQQVYTYPTVSKATENAESEQAHLRLIPLEIVFRFGMPTGSSLIERLEKDPSYAHELGIKNATPGALFAHPVVEFYTKLEPKDRLLSWQEAALMSQLDGRQLENLVEVALDVALALYVTFAELGIELWDGKVEMVEELGKEMPLLADSIGPDELRLLYKGCHLSKEMIRQIYKDSEWKKQLKQAQEIAKTDPSGRSWKEIAIDQLHAAPERLQPDEQAIVNQLYGVLANSLIGTTIFKDHPSLEQFVQELPPELRGATAGSTKGTTARSTAGGGAR